MPIHFVAIDDENQVLALMSEYYMELLAPVDGMWETLHYVNATGFLLKTDGTDVAFCKINDKKQLLVLYTFSAHEEKTDEIVDALISQKKIKSAKMASSHPASFNACLWRAKSVKADTLLYGHSGDKVEPVLNSNQRFVVAQYADFDTAQQFFLEQVNFNDEFGYTDHLISRSELFFLYESDQLVATGECRLSDTQNDYADVGMIVHKKKRGKGLATLVLKLLIDNARKKKRLPICSTTADNLPAQQAIKKAGFVSVYRIYEMFF
ncbi:MAG: GNAT family N-acetyltransferase [Calditrichaeota bacterium]|nr:GNAT family N-acetyltransferase [Calditrichota bacterium]